MEENVKGHSETYNNFHGKKGRSGRKSMFKEKLAAEILQKAFLSGVDMEKLKSLPTQKYIKLIDWYIMKAFKSDRILSDVAGKILPDKMNVEGNMNIDMTQRTLEIEKAIDEL